MILKKLDINNFRNFNSISIELDNKNVVFGMNDVGKTNFLYALRFLLDKDIRKNGFMPTDYHRHNTKEKIQITLTVDLSDFYESEDTKKFVSETRDGGVRTSERGDIFYIRVEGEYNEEEVFGEPIMKWGDNLEDLKDMPFRGTSYSIDNIFKLVYINPLVDLQKLFEKNRRYIFDENSSEKEDKELIDKINKLTKEVNDQIGNMSIINNFQNDITDEYKKLNNEEISIEIKSEMAINGFFSDLMPYIKRENDDNYYPTSGDGRRKILSYSLLNYINKKKYDNKIVIYLLEEPENNLHRSMQISLSKQLFDDDTYKYLFISTHSSQILYEMDKAMLIRIHSKEKIECNSYLYKIEPTYKTDKKKLNREFSNALFYESVLLIEGPSERILFEKILDEVNPDYEQQGGYILQVSGTYFKTYIRALKSLDIKVIVKTDNDLRGKKGNIQEYELLGINRCCDLINIDKIENIIMPFNSETKKEDKLTKLKSKKKELYKEHESLINKFKQNNIYLSEIDLENDLFSIIGPKMSEYLQKEEHKVVSYLQDRKLFNMVELIEHLTFDDCEAVYEDEKFKCLKEMVRFDG
ncbi:ATP-dependent nuclease [Intestinibacter bartlettii]|uniref:ATP-dependent nuclease n=1 Tax=Intestinibacter bartlettii TaxID=261299 RepID=UPI0026759CD5|nr:AAA family ATPase [Intestinibacter bartlettii]